MTRMTLADILSLKDTSSLKQIFMQECDRLRIASTTHRLGILAIIGTLKKYPELTPKLSAKFEPISAFVAKYSNGYENRSSVRFTKPSPIVPDNILEVIIGAKYTRLPKAEIGKVVAFHRIAMTAENILGSLLEEYIADRLPEGWYSCWGECIKSVDIVSNQGVMIQIKNRSNSENSSSSKIRAGTEIKKWHRIDANTGRTQWEKLGMIIPGIRVSEPQFHEFVKNTISTNPNCMCEISS
jgi:hypothetical protein